MVRVAVLVMIAGCDLVFPIDASLVDAPARDGVPELDAPPDADPCAGHDEDGDGHGDVCDNCPVDPNVDQQNTDDSDEVGDECDPTLQIENKIAFYTPLQSVDGVVFTGAGSLDTSDPTGSARLGMDAAMVTIAAFVPREIVVDLGIEGAFDVSQVVEIRVGNEFCRVEAKNCLTPGTASACLRMANGSGVSVGAAFNTVKRISFGRLGANLSCSVGAMSAGSPGNFSQAPVRVSTEGIATADITVDSVVVYIDVSDR